MQTAERHPRAPKLLVITPVRDEEKNIGHTIHSVCAQTHLPTQWIIVDDNSDDETYAIIRSAARNHPWITAVRHPVSQRRETGGGVVRAFQYGLSHHATVDDWDFIVKLDGDIILDSAGYFEGMLREFDAWPRLGIASGICYYLDNNRRVFEVHPQWHARGPSKIYRRQCFEDIGGLVPAPGWDGIDEYHAWFHGWESRCFSRYTIHHLTQTGLKIGAGGTLDRFRYWGVVSFNMGLWPPYVLMRILYRIKTKPYLIGALYMLAVYLRKWLTHQNTLLAGDLQTFIHRKNKAELVTRIKSIMG